LKPLFALIFPGGLIVLAAVFFVHWNPDLTPLRSLPAFVPPAILLVGALIAVRFQRILVLYGLTVIGLAGCSLWAAAGRGDPEPVRHLAAILLPLNLTAFALLTERGLVTVHGILRALLLGAQSGGAWWILRHGWAPAAPLLEASPAGSWTALSWIDLFIAGSCCLVLLGISLRRRGPIEGGFLWSLLCVLLALSAPDFTIRTLFFLTAGILALSLSVIEVGYVMSFRDELTGLPGRRALNESLSKLGKRYTIAMVDVDRFKRFNDRFGHDAGDEALRMVASRLSRVTGGGKAYRYGGEEFTLLFPGKTLDQARPHLETLRKSVASEGFVVRSRKRPSGKKVRNPGKATVTVSIGAAERSDGRSRPEEVIRAADKALYRAKKAGRNRVRC